MVTMVTMIAIVTSSVESCQKVNKLYKNYQLLLDIMKEKKGNPSCLLPMTSLVSLLKAVFM